jgi:PAS domain S-box-containing protein
LQRVGRTRHLSRSPPATSPVLPMKLTTADKVTTGFAIALGIVLVIGIAAITSIQRFLATSNEVARTHAVLIELHSAIGRLSDAESAQRGYVITGDAAYLAPFETAAGAVPRHIAELRAGTSAVDARAERLDRLADLADRRLAIMQSVVAARRDQGADSATAIIGLGSGKEVMDSIRGVASDFESHELERLEARTASATAGARLALGIIGGGSLFGFLIVLGASLMIRRDHAERRRAEQALRDSETLLSQFMENLPIGVIVIDADWQARFTNNAAVEILGMSVLVDLSEAPLPLYRASDGAPYPETERPLFRALAGQTTSIDDAAVDVGGRRVPVQMSAAPIYDASGRIAYAIAAFSDISDRRRTEAALTAAKDAAEEASRTKSEFLARMSHELRTPLNSVIGFANILLKNKAGNLREQDGAYLARILENGKHLLLLINDILDLAKIEAGKVAIEERQVDLHELIIGVVSQFDPQTRPEVRLRTEIPQELQPLVTDSARLTQVLLNLVGNAVKFTERGEIVVAVERARGTQAPARITVSDTGIGIPEHRLDAIFDAFEQAESTTSRKYGGTGLGLPISRALCDLLGYVISVRSAAGEGTTFTIDLLPGIGIETGQLLAGPHADDRSCLVLVVDDEQDSRVLLTHYVEEFGCRAVSAASGAAALRLARELRPDLITLDLMMPGLTGWQLLEQLKADPNLADIPTVIVSIIAQESRASLLGAIDVLAKPLDRDALFAVLERNLPAPQRSRILVIEDAIDARHLLLELLSSQGADVRTAENGQAALALLRSFDPDLVITDLLMPVMDGMTFLDAFRSVPRYQSVPVIVITAKDLTPGERARLDRNTAAVLQKGNALKGDLRRVLGAIFTPAAAGAADHAPADDAAVTGAANER